MPTTRWRGKPETLLATQHMASSGLVTKTRIDPGEYLTACSVALLTLL